MTLEAYQRAVAGELARQLAITLQDALGECEGLEDMFADDLPPADAASEIMACMADCIGDP